MTQVQLETVDFNNAPSPEKIEEGLKFIEKIKQEGHSVYVHCKAGRGRSATLVACYLMKVSSLFLSDMQTAGLYLMNVHAAR